MGSGSFTRTSYESYCRVNSKTYDADTMRVHNQVYRSTELDKSLNPKNVIRECCNTEEHPNTIAVILALDVTGSMGAACDETAQALGPIMTKLYSKFQDVEFLVMGIGDLSYDDAPIQASQFESDIRIAESLDKVYMEKGGGGNGFESYTAAWFFGLHNTKLDCFDKQGRKGIIITMGDEPMNPYLPREELNFVMGSSVEADVETKDLYKEASKKFDIFHISIDDPSSSYRHYSEAIKNSFGKMLGQRNMTSSIEKLGDTICDCIEASVSSQANSASSANSGFFSKISW